MLSSARIPVLDGRKMSKRLRNAICAERKRRRHSRKTKVMVTDRRASGVAILESGRVVRSTTGINCFCSGDAEVVGGGLPHGGMRLHRVQAAMGTILIK